MMVCRDCHFNNRDDAHVTDGTAEQKPGDQEQPPLGRKPLTEQAKRALAEAEERRRAYLAEEARMPRELGGRGGKEPGRYGDWEVKGLATDF